MDTEQEQREETHKWIWNRGGRIDGSIKVDAMAKEAERKIERWVCRIYHGHGLVGTISPAAVTLTSAKDGRAEGRRRPGKI